MTWNNINFQVAKMYMTIKGIKPLKIDPYFLDIVYGFMHCYCTCFYNHGNYKTGYLVSAPPVT